ncbi:hypothetical protein GQX73_g10307 [Xylaria multiplex]|uniref:Uncharacterized protein n=1 Tax=Xylaria multiplex TaxID=323545 RepID=A0A7C8IGR4_9PEZI|nr:hypothetical protein GQX73_g10307 [Xylaria multiplex]
MTAIPITLSLAPRSREEQFRFVQNIWPKLPEGDFVSADYQFFFEFIDQYLKEKSEKSDDFAPVRLDHTRDEIGKYMQRLQEQPTLKKVDLISESSSCAADDVVPRTIELAATFLLGTPVDSDYKFGRMTWDVNMDLGEAVVAAFGSASASDSINSTEDDNIPSYLTMHYLRTRYNYQVLWTNDIRQHLDINSTHRQIKVYEHLVCLWNHFRFPALPLPKDVIDGAIGTLFLLFPPDLKETRRVLKVNKDRTFYKLGYCGRKRCLKLSEYGPWRGRVSELRRILDDSPRGIYQLLSQKNGQKFIARATFWVTIFTTAAVLILGIIDAVHTTKSYRIFQKQLEVETGVACVDSKAADALPKYCH